MIYEVGSLRLYDGPIPDSVDAEPAELLLEVEGFEVTEETLHGTGAENRKVDQSNTAKLDGVCILLGGARVMLQEVLDKTPPDASTEVKWALYEMEKAERLTVQAACSARERQDGSSV